MATRKIEMYVGYLDNTWATHMIEIPADTPEGDIDRVAIDATISEMTHEKKTEIAFCGVYHLDVATETYETCDECGAKIPSVAGGGLANKHHKESCSLYDKNEE